jgi:hypothetical protein
MPRDIITAMRKTAAPAIIAALALAATCACSAATPQPSHADALACRTVWRMQQLYDASGGIPAFAPGGQAAAALGASAAGTSQPLRRDLTAASHALLLVNTPDTAQLAPLERDCTRLGITAANAEDTS